MNLGLLSAIRGIVGLLVLVWVWCAIILTSVAIITGIPTCTGNLFITPAIPSLIVGGFWLTNKVFIELFPPNPVVSAQ